MSQGNIAGHKQPGEEQSSRGKSEADLEAVVALNTNSVRREKAAPSGSDSARKAAGRFGPGASAVEM